MIDLLEGHVPTKSKKWTFEDIVAVMYTGKEHDEPHVHMFYKDGRSIAVSGKKCRMKLPRYIDGELNTSPIDPDELVFDQKVTREVIEKIARLLNTRKKKKIFWKDMISEWRGSFEYNRVYPLKFIHSIKTAKK